jgi:hypothetical protein
MTAKILTFSSHGDTTLLEYDPATADMEEVNRVIAEYEAKTGAQPFDMTTGERIEKNNAQAERSLDGSSHRRRLAAPTKKSVHAETIAFLESRRVAFASYVDSSLLPVGLFSSSPRSACRNSGLIEGEWKPTENNRRAKYYALTQKG